ncbi:MAG: glycosyltransferase family 4 protein [Phycisphaerales bacterium]|nr:glycosyltransferase family 4 protein [Phycisphaerales bacterium]
MTRRLKINWVFPRPNLSGGVKSNRLLAEAMIRRGHEVTLIHPTRRELGRHSLRYQLRRLGEQIFNGVTGGSVSNRHHLERSTARIRVIERDVVTEQDVPDADVSIATWWRTREWIEPWSTAKGVKVYFIRGYEVHGGDPDRVRATYRLPGPKLVIARWLQRLMAEEFGDPHAVLVPNGVDRSQFQAPERAKGRVPAVGMLYGRQAIKGAPTAFEAIRLLQRRDPSIRVVSFGSQPPLRAHTPPGNFEFHLCPDQSVIPTLYSRTDCWIVPSTTEGFGMPGIEAAACRCPLVVTRCGGPEDFVEDGRNGFLVPVGDAQAMADAVSRVLTSAGEQWSSMSRASYEISLRFDWDRSAEILEKALTIAVERHAAAASGRCA